MILDVMEIGTLEEDATGNAMVGTNDQNSIHIVNYLQNNVFSGEKEEKIAICRDYMKDIHVIDDDGNVAIKSLDEFASFATDIRDYTYKGLEHLDFDTILELALDDTDFYTLLTGKSLPDKSLVQYDTDFVQEETLLDEIAVLKDQVLLEASQVVNEKLYELPVLSEFVEGRPWNFYTDINGYFIKNEVTGARSSSHDAIAAICESVLTAIKRGY